MLKDLLSVPTIITKVQANDWKEAIIKAAKPMVDMGKIKSHYIEAIINSVNANGPYFVLAPQIALPHARPEEGAIEDAIGIAVLEKPVKFGSESNDPVKYLFTLSATSNDKHLQALAQLAILMEDEEFFKLLDRHPLAVEVMEYIDSKGKEV